MAFGASGDNVEIKVTLDTKGAEVQAAKFQSSVKDAFGRIQTAAQSPITALQNIGKEFLSASPSVAKFTTAIEGASASLVPLALAAATATAGVALLAVGFNKLISIAAEGDRFGDVADAFAENALQAGVAADVLERELGQALNNTVSRTNLLIAANKAFAAGIDPRAFDDLAAASKRYADSVGIDATQALDTFIGAVRTGRTGILEQIGTIEGGVLVLKKFTEEQYNVAQANKNVTDTAEKLSAGFASVYEKFAVALNNSKALQLATELLGGALLKLTEILGALGQGIIYVADLIAGEFQRQLRGVNATIVFTSSIISDLASGSLPDFGKATDAAVVALKKVEASAKDAGTVSIKLKKGLDDVAVSAKKVAKDVPSAADEIATLANKTTTSIEKAFGFKSQLETKIQNDVTAAFKAFKGNDGALVAALDKINRDILAKITDPEKAKEATQTMLDAIKTELDAQKDTKTDAGSLFGFQIEGLSTELAGQLQSAISSALSIVTQAFTSGIGREDVAGIGGAIGQGIGGAIGASLGSPEAGAAIGNIVGTITGQLASQLGQDSSGTKARKAADEFFADVFDAQRLSVIINGQIKQIQDLQFTGNEDATFEGVAPQVQASFQAVGAAFEQLLGISEDYSGRIASVLLGNIGDSLVNLQALVQSTGKSFEDLGNAIFEAFFSGSIGIQEAQDALVKLNEIFQVGIPGQIGAIDQAVQNLQISLANDKGSRIIFNSLRGIGAEALEVGKNLGQAAQSIAAGLGLGADKVAQFLQAMKLAGINSVQELVDASNAKLLALAANIKQITAGGDPTNTEVQLPTSTTINSAPNFTPIATPKASSSGSKGVSKQEQERKKREAEQLRALQALQSETIKLVTASSAYNTIIGQVNDKTAQAGDIGNKLNDLYSKQFKVLETLRNAQEAYDKALKKGIKGKDLVTLANDLKKAQKAADDFKKSLESSNKVDLSTITRLIKDMNTLGVVSKAVGVNAEALTSTLIQGFLRGKLSITQVNEQIARTKDLLGDGIPGAIGAVNDAFRNLQRGGRNGGLFSVDAFKDIFAEFDELFKKESGPERKRQFEELTSSFNNTRDALQSGISVGKTPEEIAKLRDEFTVADKALKDFNSTIPKAGFEDLRAKLKESFSSDDVDKFFTALQQSGITTFEEFKSAGTDAVVGILGNLDNLGFSFASATDENTKKIIEAFDAANIKQTEGKDILGEQVRLIGEYLTGAGSLPSTFQSGADALSAFDAPLANLSASFGDLLGKLSQFQTTNYDKNILLNVDLSAKNQQTQDLLDLLFGDGAGIIDTDTGTPGTSTGLTTLERREFEALRRKKKTGKLSAADTRRFNELTAKRGR